MASLLSKKRVTRASQKSEISSVEDEIPSVTSKKAKNSDMEEDIVVSLEEQRNAKCLSFESKSNSFNELSVNTDY